MAAPDVPLGSLLALNQEYVDDLEPRPYPKLSVKLYGRGVEMLEPVIGSSVRMKRHQLAVPGQVIVSEIWGKKGAVGIVPEVGRGALCTSHFFLFDVDTSRVDLAYLDTLFRTNYLEVQLGESAKGTTSYAAVRPRHFLAATVPLPNLNMQQRIVESARKVEDRVTELLRTANQIASSAARYQSRFLAEQTSVLTRKVGCERLGDLVAIVGGGTPDRANPEFWGGTVPWISPKDMKKHELMESQEHITAAALAESSARLINPGAVLIVVRGMILVRDVPVALLRVPAAINQDMKALIPREDLAPEYLLAVLQASAGDLLDRVKRSTHDTRKLETGPLLDYEIPVAPPAEQASFAHIVSRVLITRRRIAELQARVREAASALEISAVRELLEAS